MAEVLGASLVPAREGRVVQIGPLKLTWKEEGSGTAGRLAIAEIDLPPKFGPPPHIHRKHEESFFVLEGEVEFKVGAKTIRAEAGGFVMVPIGVPHTFGNPSDGMARMLTTMSPNLYVPYFDDIAALFQAGQPAPAAVLEVMSRYATEPAGGA